MKLFLVILLSVGISYSYGQNADETLANRAVSQIQLAFDQQEFSDRFSVLAFSDESYDYYVIDLTKFDDGFERV